MSGPQQFIEGIKPTCYRLLPILFIILLFIIFPPIALAISVAFFTSPLLISVRSTTKLPLTISTILVIFFILLMITAFFYIGIFGLIDIIPVLEAQLSAFAINTDYFGKIISFLEKKLVEYGETIVTYSFSMIQTTFQQLLNVFIFLICYFLTLRESGKSRYWFLIYFPKKSRRYAKQTLTTASDLMNSFFYVEARLIFMTFLILTIGFFALGFQSPLSLAFLISLVDSLPLLGIGFFLIPMIVFYFYISDFWTAIFLLSLYLIVIVTRQLAESYMWASTFQIRPIHAFLIFACALYAFGLFGILLSPFLLFAADKLKKHPLFNE